MNFDSVQTKKRHFTARARGASPTIPIRRSVCEIRLQTTLRQTNLRLLASAVRQQLSSDHTKHTSQILIQSAPRTTPRDWISSGSGARDHPPNLALPVGTTPPGPQRRQAIESTGRAWANRARSDAYHVKRKRMSAQAREPPGLRPRPQQKQRLAVMSTTCAAASRSSAPTP